MKQIHNCMFGQWTLEVIDGKIDLSGLRGMIGSWVLYSDCDQMTIRLFAEETEADEAYQEMEPQCFELDEQGRFALPERFLADLKAEDTVVRVGMGSFIEIVKHSDLLKRQEKLMNGTWEDLENLLDV